jgi:RNA polymerase primary sigma factor
MHGTHAPVAGTGNSLRTYFHEIRDESLLTAAEECALADAIARGDADARTRMIQANLRLVVKIANEYSGRGVILEDLIGEGNIGLIRAVEQFEPRFGTRFSTYASYWIKQSIRKALLNTTSMIRLPAHIVGLMNKWRRAERALARERGFTPSFNDVASFLGLSKTQSTLVFKAHRARGVKLESCVAADAGRWSPVEAMDPCPPPDTVMENNDERHRLLQRLATLDGRERTILMLRYGLDEDEPMTLKQIGQRLGVTREWVRKIEVGAVRKLNRDEYAERAQEKKASHAPSAKRSIRRPPPTTSTSPSHSTAKPVARLNNRSQSQGPQRPASQSVRTGLYWLAGDGSRRNALTEKHKLANGEAVSGR